MKTINIICIEKNKDMFIVEGIKNYIAKINRFVKINIVYLKGLNKKNISEEELKSYEFRMIANKLEQNSYKILLDVEEDLLDSFQFANFLNKIIQFPNKIEFIIGGVYGVSEELKKMVNKKISLSKLTFSHQLVRLILLEQIYRGFCIMNNVPYHK
ncbi:MAG TPA: 23S rRNA (pseudouridine(1915)-N(3))-methyltransferase RlmH [Candidatus Desulfofervidus auxilii]|uniref:Ribosomal RNA large subunit methyltransferase H n=1 Tax=Desulfofervidus auxilii TaxID=1621989 RepID=A0A7C0U2D6_DESA2|nr:23S rRNA (pseudouridine(1915)-N(3))-methyltransferase RlmH [Candidatus Desulfofervidus auxilii]